MHRCHSLSLKTNRKINITDTGSGITFQRSRLQYTPQIHTHTHMHAHMHACTHAPMHTHTCTHAHTHTHTHTHLNGVPENGIVKGLTISIMSASHSSVHRVKFSSEIKQFKHTDFQPPAFTNSVLYT